MNRKMSNHKTKDIKRINKNLTWKSRYKTKKAEKKPKKSYKDKKMSVYTSTVEKYMIKPKIRARIDLSDTSSSAVNTQEKPKKKAPKRIKKPIENSSHSWIFKPEQKLFNEDEITHRRKLREVKENSNDTMSIIYRHFNAKK